MMRFANVPLAGLRRSGGSHEGFVGARRLEEDERRWGGYDLMRVDGREDGCPGREMGRLMDGLLLALALTAL